MRTKTALFRMVMATGAPRVEMKKWNVLRSSHPRHSSMEHLTILKEMAVKLNDAEYASWCGEKMTSVKNNFNKAYLRQITGTDHWTYGSQTGIVIAYRMGLIPDDKKAAVSEGLVYDINNLHGGHISTGIHGQRIYSVLCDMGLEELAYSILTTPTYPSLAYTVAADQTTWPEAPQEWKNRSHPQVRFIQSSDEFRICSLFS